MADHPYADLQRSFEAAALHKEAEKGLGPEDWRRYRALTAACEEQKIEAGFRFEADYDQRQQIALRQVLAEAIAWHRVPRPQGVVQAEFQREMLERRAHARVLADHDRELIALERARDAALAALCDRAEKRKVLRLQFNDDFTRASQSEPGPNRNRTGPD